MSSILPEFNLFSKHPTLYNAVEKTVEVHSPTFMSPRGGVVQFSIPPSSLAYTSPTFGLRMELNVYKYNAEGVRNNLDADDNVAIADNYVCTAFQSVQLFLNGILVEDARNYDHLSRLKLLLSTSWAYKEQMLQYTHGFSLDTAGTFDDTSDVNEGRLVRKNRVSGSKRLVLSAPLNLDFSSCTKFLPPGIKISLKLQHNEEACRLHCADRDDTTYFCEFASLELYVTRTVLRSEISEAVQNRLAAGETINFEFKRLCISGPYELENPSESLRALHWYDKLMQVAGTTNNFACGLTPPTFCNGATILAISLTHDALLHDYVPLTEEARLEAVLEFSKPLPDNALLFAAGLFSDTVSLNKYHQVQTSFVPGSMG